MCTEEIPRHERAAENYMKQSAGLDDKIKICWTKWCECRQRMHTLFKQALSECSSLSDFVEKLQLQSEMRLIKASDELRYKLLCIENEEIKAFTEYMSDMPSMLKKLYLTLKGYGQAPPALTAEYLEIMKKAKLAKGITWCDSQDEGDDQFKFISTLDLEKPIINLDFDIKKDGTITDLTDSEDLTDIENRNPLQNSAMKRKGTPTKLNNETVLIDDSIELDTTRTLGSAKKFKQEYDIPVYDNPIDPNNLNSTFVLPAKLESLKKQPIKNEVNLTTRSAFMNRPVVSQRMLNFNDKGKIKINKAKAFLCTSKVHLVFIRKMLTNPFKFPIHLQNIC